jgi:hypothetical protein
MGMLYRALSTGFVAPCLSTKAHKPAFGIGLVAREQEHDGFGTRKDGNWVWLYSRPATT